MLQSSFSFPLKNPILIFSLILFIILLAPVLLRRLRIPHVVGLILAGVLIGPYGTNLMERDASIVLFGTVGILYIMFIAGLEVDIADFVKQRNRSLVFGLYTFSIPMALGTFAGKYALQMSWPAAILLGSLFASHTLLAYPIVSRYGITKNVAVTIAIGGTVITDILALLVLAVIVGMSRGTADGVFWSRLGISTTLFVAFVMFVIPRIARFIYKRIEDEIAQYIFTLGIVFFCAFLAEAAGIEGIIGAFLAGLSLNLLIPRTSPLMNRIDFVGNALFIPFFLIGVGMLVNLKIFFISPKALLTAALMTTIAMVSKYAAAFFTQKTFRLSVPERGIIFGLSNAQAAATLAAVLVGYQVVLGKDAQGADIRLLSEDILNGTILMILVTCTVAAFITERAARKVADKQTTETVQDEKDARVLLIALSETNAAKELIDLASAMVNRKAGDIVRGIHIVNEAGDTSDTIKHSRKLLEQAGKYAAGSGFELPCDLRVDLNVTTGLIHAAQEKRAEELLAGFHKKTFLSRSTIGHIIESYLERSRDIVYMYHPVQPLGTYKRLVVVVPPHAERNHGFSRWFRRLRNLATSAGLRTVFYGTKNIEVEIRRRLKAAKDTKPVDFVEFDNWENFAYLRDELASDDFLVVVLSRKGTFSDTPVLYKIPDVVQKYFQKHGVLLVFPRAIQPSGIGWGQDDEMITPIRDAWRSGWKGVRRFFRGTPKRKEREQKL
ncbi:MAG: Glutathione-regulated potassium-efflux system protein KefB [Turneriella sp.]|nr:Glutathione-regulated potassium-efflux system protein KefB [Turneriella sp.]